MGVGRKSHYSLYKPGKKRNSFILKVFKYLLIVLILYELLTGFLVSTVIVENSSMIPLIQKNERLLVFKPIYPKYIFNDLIKIPGIGQPKRGDIVTYNQNFETDYPWYLKPVNSVISFFTFQKINLKTKYDYNNRINIGRVIAVPGDTIKIKNSIAYIKEENSENFIPEFTLLNDKYNINISTYPENWDSKSNPFYSDIDEIKIEQRCYFIMGDNRELYIDSRNSSLVPIQNIKGKIVFRYWPFRAINVLQ